MKYRFNYKDKPYEIEITEKDKSFFITINGERTYQINDYISHSNHISFVFNNELKNVYIAMDNGKVYVAIDGEYYLLEPVKVEKKKEAVAVAHKSNFIVSPMPGLLVKIPVKIGDSVKSGTTLAIVEAMKMQNELRAPIDGIVKKINFKEGEQVDAFVPIVELEG